MNKLNTTASLVLLTSLQTGCLTTGGSSGQPNSVLVSEVITICGAIVGEQAEQRINQEWTKYPSAEANRPVIEAVARSLLNDPNSTEEERTSQYRRYLTCATGLLMTNGIVK